MSIRTVVLLAFAASLGLAGSSLAASPSGEAVAVMQAANARGPGGTRVLAVKGPVFMGDVIKTDADGEVQLIFKDDTRLVVGPNSQMTIDRFILSGPSTAKTLTINAVRGAFRFITGHSSKQAYSIHTPTAVVGVRGTKLDLSIINGVNHLGLYDGTAFMCDQGTPRRCALLQDRCGILVFDPQNRFNWVRNVNQRVRMFQTIFPFAFRQFTLRPDFRVDSTACSFTSRDVAPRASQETHPTASPPENGGNQDQGPPPPPSDDCGAQCR